MIPKDLWKLLFPAFTGMCFLASTHGLQADISIDKALIEFKADGEYYTDIKVFNNDRKKAYISVNVKEVINPGQATESRQLLDDPDKALLVVTPSRLIVEGNQSSPVRLLNLDEDHEKERIYRVLIEPASGRTKSEQDVVNVLVAYDILVIVRPEKPTTNILARREGKTMTFYNAGSTNIYLEDGKQCDPVNKSNCESITGDRLYAGASWKITLPFETDVAFNLNDGEAAPKKTFTGKDTLPKSTPQPLKE